MSRYAIEDIARRLREFGYPDVRAVTVRAVLDGTKKDTVLSAFIKSMLPDYGSPGL